MQGPGSSVGCPRDEYDNEASRVAALLRQTEGDSGASLGRMFDASGQTERLAEREQPVLRVICELESPGFW